MHGHDRPSPAIAAACLAAVLAIAPDAHAIPPRLDIYHFDVNAGDATLIVSPDGHGILIDAGPTGCGRNPVKEFMDRAKQDGRLTSLDYVVATHYDEDHIGGMDEVLENGWYPTTAVYDRGDSFLPPFDEDYVEEKCSVDVSAAEAVADWGGIDDAFMPDNPRASCALIDYFLAAEAGGKRKTIKPGDVLTLGNHGVELVTLVVNAKDIDGESVDVFQPGRRDDYAANDLSVGLLLKFGDFRYLVAGDLTGDPGEDVADVEELIKDDAADLDVYHVNHHGSRTSSSSDFMIAAHPTVAIASQGTKHGHPTKAVIQDRILSLNPPPAVYITNRNADTRAWQAPTSRIADRDPGGVDGLIQVSVWQQSYRVFAWRQGAPRPPGDRYFIKDR